MSNRLNPDTTALRGQLNRSGEYLIVTHPRPRRQFHAFVQRPFGKVSVATASRQYFRAKPRAVDVKRAERQERREAASAQ